MVEASSPAVTRQKTRVWRRPSIAAAALIVSVAAVRCGSSAPTEGDAPPEHAPAAAPDRRLDAGGDAVPPAPDTLTGNWLMHMGRTSWFVRLEPRAGSPSEYEGTGTRTTPGENGRDITMGIGAIVEGREFRAWIGKGLVQCAGPFVRAGTIHGACTSIDGVDLGPLRAERQ